MIRTSLRPRREGYVLIAVLVVIVVLSLAAYRFTDSMGGEFRASVRTSDAAQARAAAVSGVHYAAALLADPDAFAVALGGDPTANNPDVFSGVLVRSDPNKKNKEAYFNIVSVATTGPGTYEQRFALTDEGGKLNINALIAQDGKGNVLYNALLKLPNMTPDLADCIVDWVDADDTQRPLGAENIEYQSRDNPYKAKNGPLNSIDELLLVKGMTPQLLYGSDQNQSGGGERGLSDYLTVFGREVNADAAGTLKVWVNYSAGGDDSPQPIYQALGTAELDKEMAAYIMAYRFWTRTQLDENGMPTGKAAAAKVEVGSADQLITAVEDRMAKNNDPGKAINSVADLINTRVTLPKVPGSTGDTVVYSPLNSSDRRRELLPVLLNKVAMKEAVEMIPRLNVNTAPREVLLGLPGLTEDDVDAIVGARDGLDPSTLEATTGAWLVTVANLSPQKFKAIEKYVTGTSMIYRVQVVGYLAGGGPTARVEAVIDTNLGSPRILYFRDLGDLDSPRGFPVVKPTQP